MTTRPDPAKAARFLQAVLDWKELQRTERPGAQTGRSLNTADGEHCEQLTAHPKDKMDFWLAGFVAAWEGLDLQLPPGTEEATWYREGYAAGVERRHSLVRIGPGST